MTRILLNIYNFNKKLLETFLCFFKVVFLSKRRINFKKITHSKTKILLLGNGPSLTDYIENNIDTISSSDCLALNHFAISDYFQKVKPRYYVAIAHDLFLDDVAPNFIEASNKLFKAMAKNTKWDLFLFVPHFARKHKRWQNILSENQNIKIKYINLTPISGFKSFEYFAFKKNWGLPRPHNVMIPAIYLSILLGYKKVIISGADHSWLKGIFVNDKNETMFINDHFYDPDAKPKRFDYKGQSFLRLDEILLTLSKAFASYHKLREWADKKGVILLNVTKNSYIDAFERT